MPTAAACSRGPVLSACLLPVSCLLAWHVARAPFFLLAPRLYCRRRDAPLPVSQIEPRAVFGRRSAAEARIAGCHRVCLLCRLLSPRVLPWPPGLPPCHVLARVLESGLVGVGWVGVVSAVLSCRPRRKCGRVWPFHCGSCGLFRAPGLPYAHSYTRALELHDAAFRLYSMGALLGIAALVSAVLPSSPCFRV